MDLLTVFAIKLQKNEYSLFVQHIKRDYFTLSFISFCANIQTEGGEKNAKIDKKKHYKI